MYALRINRPGRRLASSRSGLRFSARVDDAIGRQRNAVLAQGRQQLHNRCGLGLDWIGAASLKPAKRIRIDSRQLR
jgi:hypothetical protein